MQEMKSVAILGLGPSVREYLELTKRFGGRKALCDETWGINALGDVFVCDRIFHMDDVRIQEIRAAARPQSNIAKMLQWLKSHPGPVYTSRAHQDYPGLVEFPLEEVMNGMVYPYAYFNSTAAYAAAYAIHIGVKKIYMFGCDFTYPNAHDAEKGRACVEFWMGYAAAKGVELSVPHISTLMDACHTSQERVYGNDTRTVSFSRDESGRIKVKYAEIEQLPTADEIEARYDHSAHPNTIVENGG
jgi:hypothetical protein